jgi:hypothetical protein
MTVSPDESFVLCSQALFPTCSHLSSAFRTPATAKIGKARHSGLDFAPLHG